MPVAIEVPTGLTPPLPHKQWTRAECARLESAGLLDGERYELIEGELLQRMGKNQPHMRAVQLLISWLRKIYGEHFVAQEPSIDVSPQDNPSSEPEPDAILLRRSFLEIDLASRAHAVDLLLVAEVSGATLAFDLTVKAKLYARASIPEYWVLDLTARRVIVHRDPKSGEYHSVSAFAQDEHVATLASPAQTIRVGDLF
jgi:Uma2 family endonuclease